jgi:hypothetical protein
MRNGQKAAMFEAFGHHLQSRSPNRDEHLRRQIDEILSAIDPPMLMARLEYAARGWPTFPAPADGSKKSEKAGERSKSRSKIYGPLMRWDATTTEQLIRNDFKKWPNQNIGIVTGHESKTFVVETDTKEHGDDINGEAKLKAWEAEHGAFPETLMAQSPSGSIHRFFNHPGRGIKIKNVAGVLDGVDVRGDGGMVLAVPSYRPPKAATADEPAKAGGVYVWVNAGHAIADAPQALLELVIERLVDESPAPEAPIDNKKAKNYERQGPRTSSTKRIRSWAEAALDDEYNKVARAKKGKRNDQLNSSAFSLGQIVGGGGLSEDEVIEALMQAATANGTGTLDTDGGEICMKTINSGLSKGKLNPRDPPDNNTLPPDDTPEAATPESAAIGKAKAGEAKQAKKKKVVGVTLGDFYALMPTHSYIFVPSREMWPASSVNTRIPAQLELDKKGKPKLKDGKPLKNKDGKPVLKKGKPVLEKIESFIPANLWLDQNKPVEMMTWAPGLPLIIQDRLISEGGWIEREGCSTFNMYRPPSIKLGDAKKATKWINLVKKVYPNDAEEIFNYCAHRRQKPEEKINHALILGGDPGIGKDTMLEALKHSIGPWNFYEASPQDVMGQWNDYIKSVVLRISEVRDLGDISRYSFYEHSKTLTAAPPDVTRCNTKYVPQHYVLNICGVIYTTNYKTNGIYLPPDDRRHYVAWSDLTMADFPENFWPEFWDWYQTQNGFEHVAAWLAERDISKFNAKAPPIKTAAFWAIVDANAAPEESEMADVLDQMGNPDAITLNDVTAHAEDEFQEWLMDRKNRRIIPHRFEKCNYIPVRSESDDGLWVIQKKRQVVYARKDLLLRDQITAARKIAKDYSGMKVNY